MTIPPVTNASCRGAPAVPSVMDMSSGVQLGIVAAVDDSTAARAAPGLARWQHDHGRKLLNDGVKTAEARLRGRSG